MYIGVTIIENINYRYNYRYICIAICERHKCPLYRIYAQMRNVFSFPLELKSITASRDRYEITCTNVIDCI